MRNSIGVNGIVKQIKSVLFEGKRYVIKGKRVLGKQWLYTSNPVKQQLGLGRIEWVYTGLSNSLSQQSSGSSDSVEGQTEQQLRLEQVEERVESWVVKQ